MEVWGILDIMPIKFVLMVNKQGQTRLSNYFEWLSIQERVALEAEIIRRCLSRTGDTSKIISDSDSFESIVIEYPSLFYYIYM